MFNELTQTSCAGIGHNMIAKLINVLVKQLRRKIIAIFMESSFLAHPAL